MSRVETKYVASPGTLADGQVTIALCDANGRTQVAEQYAPQAEDNTNAVIQVVRKVLAVATYCPSLYTNFAGSVTKANVKAAPGNVYSLVATNTNAAARYLLLHNKATAPAATEAGLVAFPVPASGSLVIGADWFTENGINFTTGIGWSIGTTVGQFTDSATASQHTVQITYK